LGRRIRLYGPNYIISLIKTLQGVGSLAPSLHTLGERARGRSREREREAFLGHRLFTLE